MKRALAERARGDDGGATTPSPTKKFARFGGGEKHLWGGGSGGTVVVGGASTASTGSHISPCSSSSSHSVSTTQVVIPPGPSDPSSSEIVSPPAPLTNETVDASADAGSISVTAGLDKPLDSSGTIMPPKAVDPAPSEVLETSNVSNALDKTASPVVPPPESAPQRTSSVGSNDRTSGPVGGSTRASPMGPRSNSRSSIASDDGVSSSSTNKRGRRPRPRQQISAAKEERDRRSRANDAGESDDDDENGASSRKFYLQFQNRALATELHRVKHDLKMLEEERTLRRSQCQVALHVLEEVNSYWTALEEALLSSRASTSDGSEPAGPADQAAGKNGVIVSKSRPSTGNGSDVETVPMLLRSLARLAKKSRSSVGTGKKRRRTGKDQANNQIQETGDEHDEGSCSDADDSFDYEDLAGLLNPLQSRVENLSDTLSGLVRDHLSRVEASENDVRSVLNQQNHRQDRSKEITLLEGRISALQAQGEELAKSRDHAKLQERRIRRYLNRILAGQVPAEVLKDVEGIRDGDVDICEVMPENDDLSHGSPSHKSKKTKRGRLADSSEPSSGSAIQSAITGEGNDRIANSGENAEESKRDDGESGVSEEEDEARSKESKKLSKQRQRIRHLEGVSEGKQARIEELMKERLALQNRISTLIGPDDNGDGASDSVDGDGSNAKGKRGRRRRRPTGEGENGEEVPYDDLMAQFKEATKRKAALEDEKGNVLEKLSAKAGDVEALRNGLEEQRSRFERRWKEVSEVDRAENGHISCDASKSLANCASPTALMNNCSNPAMAAVVVSKDNNGAGRCEISEARKVIVLQHKLQQALENARRIDAYRSALRESCSLVETLQQQSSELRSKYHAVVAQNKQSSGSSSSVSHRSSSRSIDPSSESSTSSRRSSSGHGDSSNSHTSSPNMERMQKDNRRMRKEIAALQQSRDSAKSKLERLTNERDGLVRTNSRLLQQSSEKEEINAEALGTILHLKQQLSLRDEEKDTLAQQLKSAKQLALASRLTATAKDRVGDEEKTAFREVEQKLEDAEKKHASLLQEIQEKEGKVEESKHQMVALAKDLKTAKSRCEELASESNKALDQRAKAVEELYAARKQVSELRKSVAEASSCSNSQNDASGRSGFRSGGSGSHFTAEQLSTQLGVLKGRLACPVCNHRDKSCILLRCRHMFCRQCVDNNIKNRSRKCPACATRFDMKDVGEIWL